MSAVHMAIPYRRGRRREVLAKFCDRRHNATVRGIYADSIEPKDQGLKGIIHDAGWSRVTCERCIETREVVLSGEETLP